MKNLFYKIFAFVLLISPLLIISNCAFRPRGKDEKGKVLLRSMAWMANPTENEITKNLVKEFNRLHPDINVEHETIEGDYGSKLLTSFAAGNAPDVFWVGGQGAQAWIIRNVLLDITPFIEQDKVDINDFFPATVQGFILNGHYYSLPNDACSSAMFYNKDLFDAEGIPYPDKDWRWEEFVKIAKRLTKDLNGDGKIDQWGFLIPGDIHMFMPFIFSNKGLLHDYKDPNKPLFTQPQALEAIEMILNLALKEKVAPLRGEMGDQEERRGFQVGRVAMMVSGWWDMTDTDVYAPNLNYGVAPTPIIKEKANFAFYTGTGIYVNTPHPRESWEFLKFMTGPYCQLFRCKARMAGPSRRSVSKDPYFNDREKDKVFLETIEYAQSTFGEHYDILLDEFIQARDRVLQETQTTKQAFSEAEKNFLRRIKEY